MTPSSHHMRLYSLDAERLYLNRSERERFALYAGHADPITCALCMVLLHTGCRLSEALNLRGRDVQIEECLISINSLKKRHLHHVRELPIQTGFAQQLKNDVIRKPDDLLFDVSRTTAWRRVTSVMHDAEISGIHATPKGLRHSFGVHCAFSNIPMPLAQKWMGHSDIKTTAIYYQIVGQEEREMAQRLWT